MDQTKTYGDLPLSDQLDIKKRALIAGTARGLQLPQRMRSLFAERHWPPNEDFLDYAMMAVICCACGATGQRLRTPTRAKMLGGLWDTIADHVDPAMPALMIVEHLELQALTQRA